MKICITCETNNSRKTKFVGDQCIDCFERTTPLEIRNSEVFYFKIPTVIIKKVVHRESKPRPVRASLKGVCECGNGYYLSTGRGMCRICYEKLPNTSLVIKRREYSLKYYYDHK